MLAVLIAGGAAAKPKRVRCAQASDCPRVAKASGAGQPVDACEDGRCVVKKLDEMPLTQCKADVECVVAVPRCCWCDYAEVVAIAKGQEDALARLTCTADGSRVQCPECARAGPRPKAVCRAGRCAVAR